MNGNGARTVVLTTTIAALLCLSVAHAHAASVPDAQKIENKEDYDSRILLDANQGPERQLVEAGRVRAVAETGDPYAQYLLGTLYRLGKSHPAKLFERDDDKAGKYLSNAAVNGRVFAMAGMAELELRRKQPMKAMVWTQAFAHYELVHGEIFNDKLPDHQAYAAFLLKRSFDALGHSDAVQNQIEQLFTDFMQQHDARIRAALTETRDSQKAIKQDQSALHRIHGGRMEISMPNSREQQMHSPGVAVFLAGVDAKGRVEKLLVIDSLPDQTFATGLNGSVRSMRFNTADKPGQLRWVTIPMSYDDQSVQLKNPG